MIRTLANRGDMAILLVEQFYDFAAELADSYLLMSRGTIIQRGRGKHGAGGRSRAGCDLICYNITFSFL